MSPAAIMTDIDALIKDKLVPMRNRVLDALEKKHPQIFSVMNPILANKKNKFGLQVLENGRVVGEYVLYLSGLRVEDVENGKLDSEIHHPFMGVIKPYASIERKILEKVISDEKSFENELFPTVARYLPEMTVKFLH
ncbi:MAG: hypothetical protein H6Q73_1281 [Firmicutes bacterium]|nr:hypothetical protein [Bacillota bacterium]